MAADNREAAQTGTHIITARKDSVCRGFPYLTTVKGQKSCFKPPHSCRENCIARINWKRSARKVGDNLWASGIENMISDYPWARSYEAAILETDRSKLAERIQIAEEAISARERELDGNRVGSQEERSAIRDALSGLRVLRDEVKQDVPEGALELDLEEDIATNSHSHYRQESE